MAVRPRTDYLSRDYEGLLTSMRQYAAASWPEWRPASEGDFGLVLLELFAYMGDILSYYTDRAQFENYLPTATQRESVLNLAYILGYVPHSGSPATGTVSLTTVAGTPGEVTIPVGLKIATNRVDAIDGPVVFETSESVVLPANGDGSAAPVQVDVVEGSTRTGVLLGTSSGEPGQSFYLPNAGVYRETIRIYVEDPAGTTVLQPEEGGPTVNVQEWTQVDRLLGETGAAKNYESRLSASYSVVTFGDDLSGEIPATGLDIYATYRYGFGSWGNLPAGVVRNVDTTGIQDLSAVRVATDASGNYVTSGMAGGADEESDQSIRDNAPLAFRSQGRVVTKEDFVSVALGVPGVSTAAAVVGSFTSVTMVITGAGGLAPPALKAAVLDALRSKTLAGVEVTVIDPTFQPIDFGTPARPITVRVVSGMDAVVVDNSVRRAITTLIEEMPAEKPLAVSDVYGAINSVSGVASAHIPVITRQTGATQTETETITPNPWEVFTVGTINLSVS